MSKLAILVVSGGPCLNGPIHLVFERSAPWPEGEIVTVTRMLEAFVAAGKRGAYPYPGTAPGQQDLELVGPATVVGPKLSYGLRGRHVDARAFQLLRHLASRLELRQASLLRITAGGSGPGLSPQTSLPAIDYENEEAQYPDGPPQPGFRVLFDDSLSYSKSRRALVEHISVIDGRQVDTLADYVHSWGALVEGGAFALPLGLPDLMDSEMGMIMQLDAFTVEVEIGTYQGSEIGFDVLLHILSTYHIRERPLRLVTIE
jgi:hypothetical protein